MKPDALNNAAIVVGVLLLALGGPWLVKEFGSLARHGSLAARADARIVVLEVGGMTCEACAGAVKGKLAELPGVTAVEVRVGERRAFVVCDPGVADTALTAAVQRAGPGFLASVAEH